MGQTGSEIYYLKEAEVKLLLAGLGIKRWYGFFSEEAAGRMPPEAFHRVLAGLYQKGVVAWEQGDALVRQPYARMLAAMLKEKRCITMQVAGCTHPLRCCYIAGPEVVVMQKSQREHATVGLSEMSAENWLGLAGEITDSLPEDACLEFSCRNSESGECEQKIAVRQEGIRVRRIDQENASGAACIHCMQEELAVRLGELLGMEGFRADR